MEILRFEELLHDFVHRKLAPGSLGPIFCVTSHTALTPRPEAAIISISQCLAFMYFSKLQ